MKKLSNLLKTEKLFYFTEMLIKKTEKLLYFAVYKLNLVHIYQTQNKKCHLFQ